MDDRRQDKRHEFRIFLHTLCRRTFHQQKKCRSELPLTLVCDAPACVDNNSQRSRKYLHNTHKQHENRCASIRVRVSVARYRRSYRSIDNICVKSVLSMNDSKFEKLLKCVN